MSLILRQALAKNEQQKRIMNRQWQEANAMRLASEGDMEQLLAMTVNRDAHLTGNAGRSPADAYREFDQTSVIEKVPAGELATLTRLLDVGRSVDLGREVFEYRKTSRAGIAQTSMSGQIGIKLDNVDVSYAGCPIPIHDAGFGRRYREILSMQADGYDALVADSRETERTLLLKADDYLWQGDESIKLKGNVWLGFRNDTSVAQATLQVDLADAASTGEDIRTEVARVRDVLRITNNCSRPLKVGVSREIMSNWERPFSTNDSGFSTIGEYVMKLRGIEEIYEDSELSGNELVMYYADSTQGMHAVIGMGLSTYAINRDTPLSDFNFVKWMAAGFLARNTYTGDTCALYASE
jgi:Family of unknown function (DUF6260)